VFISVQTGSGSISRKKGIIVHLMHSCREKEMKFLVRTLVNILIFFLLNRSLVGGKLTLFCIRVCFSPSLNSASCVGQELKDRGHA